MTSATRKSTPSVKRIAAHWSGRTLPGGARELEEDYADRPHCMACGWYEPTGTAPFRGLQRCHAIPDALGGSSDPGNLALLCARCHADAPDVADPSWFWSWVSSHPYDGDPFERLERIAVEVFAVLSAEEVACAATWSAEETLERMHLAAESAGGVVLHGGALAPSTAAALMKIAARSALEEQETDG